ncbi:MAG: PQQ-dependent sugar dehydrogenase [Candidatus Spechtbacterales bacterium]|nr:PQQ-dependent sugar dehydrogenase [Candidatus Spechtbacterales bacterium]
MKDFNKKKFILFFLGLIILSILIWGGVFWWQNLRGAGPAIKPPPDNIAEIIKEKNKEPQGGQNETEFPLSVADNFNIDIFAQDLPDARVIVQDSLGNFWVSQPDEGSVSLLTVENGEVVRHDKVFRNLNRPHGLAIDPENGLDMYIAETDKISKIRLYSEGPLEKVVDLPAGGRHWSRTIAFGPDGRLYVSIGSSCDTCIEEDRRRAAIYVMDKDGSNFESYAQGLRNAVFFTWSYVDGRMWATEMGRDHLGDNLPPDEINIIEEGGFYGWPYYYGDNVADTEFRDSEFFQTFDPPGPLSGSKINLQAHVAPLGLAFVPEEGWPEDMWYDLLVAYHGSWNRSVPVGYKIARIRLDAQGNLLSSVSDSTGFVEEEDFISGWLQGSSSLGRPVDIMLQPGGVGYITDDKAGVVYKISYINN